MHFADAVSLSRPNSSKRGIKKKHNSTFFFIYCISEFFSQVWRNLAILFAGIEKPSRHRSASPTKRKTKKKKKEKSANRAREIKSREGETLYRLAKSRLPSPRLDIADPAGVSRYTKGSPKKKRRGRSLLERGAPCNAVLSRRHDPDGLIAESVKRSAR